jgi:AraC-like DNA-binding protein
MNDSANSHPAASRAGDNPDICSRIPFTRACSFYPFISLLEEIGAPTERLLSTSHLRPDLLANPEELVPLHFAHQFVELASRKEGIENMGMLAGDKVTSFELGRFGQKLQRALTVYEYLLTGIELIGSITSGSRFWLKHEGDHVRFNQFSPGKKGTGHSQGDIFTLMVTINTLRRITDGQWSPDEIALLHGNEKQMGELDAFTEARIITGCAFTSFTLPVSLLQQPISLQSPPSANNQDDQTTPSKQMPRGFIDSLESLITMLLGNGYPEIHLAAEAAGISKRTLQRRLSESGNSYREIVERTRFRHAAELLTNTGLPIAEISACAGYKDPSNFTRAFRRRTGISPHQYRQRQLGAFSL